MARELSFGGNMMALAGDRCFGVRVDQDQTTGDAVSHLLELDCAGELPPIELQQIDGYVQSLVATNSRIVWMSTLGTAGVKLDNPRAEPVVAELTPFARPPLARSFDRVAWFTPGTGIWTWDDSEASPTLIANASVDATSVALGPSGTAYLTERTLGSEVVIIAAYAPMRSEVISLTTGPVLVGATASHLYWQEDAPLRKAIVSWSLQSSRADGELDLQSRPSAFLVEDGTATFSYSAAECPVVRLSLE